MTEFSNVTVNGRLVSQQAWEAYVESLKCPEAELSKEQAALLVRDSLVRAVRRRAVGRFGICFSGGVDSTVIALICRMLGSSFTCYSVGVRNSPDIEWSSRIGAVMGFSQKSRVLNDDELGIVLRDAVRIIGEPDVVKAGVGSVFFAAAQLAKSDGISVLFSGLGSEEIFAGYERHALAADVNSECWSGLKMMWGRDLARDFAVAKALGIEVRTPFLDPDLIRVAMSIPGRYKIQAGVKKSVLREAAVGLGLPKEFAFRKKTAAQYGSRFNDAIGRLARKNGYRLKKDYLASLI